MGWNSSVWGGFGGEAVGRILFIDDDRDALETYIKAVSLADHYAVVAASAAEALQAIQDEYFDLIFVDLNLPGISGLQLIEKLTADELVPSTPIIVLSALPEDQLLDEVIQAGAQLFLGKPVSLSDLLDVIAKFNGE